MAWNGKRYVIAGTGENGVMVLGVDSTLTVTAPKFMRSIGPSYAVSVASDGANVAVAWIQSRYTADELQLERLGPELQFLDAAAQKVAEAQMLTLLRTTPLVWDGRNYLVAWQASGGTIHIARIDRDGHRSGIDFELPTFGEGRLWATVQDLAMMPAGGNLAVAWRDSSQTFESTQFRLLRSGQIFLERSWDPVIGRPHLVQLGDRAAIAATWTQTAAPYHGAARMMLAIAEAEPRVLPELPAAPQLAARPVDADSVRLTWTAPAGTIAGYRIESSIDGGPWKEVEHWFGATDTSAIVRLLRPGVPVVFRMRAWNDAGAGAYSEEARAATPRRRSVR
jgi:Fibronectin type III domain